MTYVNEQALRPVALLKAGWPKVKGHAEFNSMTTQDKVLLELEEQRLAEVSTAQLGYLAANGRVYGPGNLKQATRIGRGIALILANREFLAPRRHRGRVQYSLTETGKVAAIELRNRLLGIKPYDKHVWHVKNGVVQTARLQECRAPRGKKIYLIAHLADGGSVWVWDSMLEPPVGTQSWRGEFFLTKAKAKRHYEAWYKEAEKRADEFEEEEYQHSLEMREAYESAGKAFY